MKAKKATKQQEIKTLTVTISMSAELARSMAAMAEKQELSISAFIRQLILKAK